MTDTLVSGSGTRACVGLWGRVSVCGVVRGAFSCSRRARRPRKSSLHVGNKGASNIKECEAPSSRRSSTRAQTLIAKKNHLVGKQKKAGTKYTRLAGWTNERS